MGGESSKMRHIHSPLTEKLCCSITFHDKKEKKTLFIFIYCIIS